MVSERIKRRLVSGCILTLWCMHRLFWGEGGQAVFQQQCTCEQNCSTFSLTLPLLHIFPPTDSLLLALGLFQLKRQASCRLENVLKYGESYQEAIYSNVVRIAFKMFYIFRGNEDLRNLTLCSVSKKENAIPWSYGIIHVRDMEYIHVRAFSAFWQLFFINQK